MKFKLMLGALGALAVAAPACAATNLIVNGGFDDQTFPGTTTYYNVGPGVADNPIPPGFAWSVPTNNVDIISYVTYGPPPPGGGGSYGLDLVGYGATGEISQSINTVAGKQYNVSFQYSNNPGITDPTAAVLYNGNVIGNVTGDGWQTFSGVLTGTGSPADFAINETYGGSNGGVFLDNISVTAVPEPASWLLMIAGVGLVGAGLRYSRRREVAAVAA